MKLESYLVLGLILGIVTVLGCISDTDNFNVKHFENENISFDYPDTWTVTVVQDLSDYPSTEWMIKIENPDDKIASVVISQVETTDTVGGNSSSVKIDGVDTLETTDNSTYRMYTFSKNNLSYEVIVYGSNTAPWFQDTIFKKYASYYDSIVNSIKLK